MNIQKGSIFLIVMIFLIGGMVIMLGASYYLLNIKNISKKDLNQNTGVTSEETTPQPSVTPEATTEANSSTSDEPENIEKDLNDTELDSIDSDLEGMNSEFEDL